MQLIKFTGADSVLMLVAVKAIQAAAKEENKHKKAREAAKKVASRLLLDLRKVNVDLLANKEIVIVQCDGQDALKIECKAAERFDNAEFSLVHPALSLEFTRATPATYFDGLLP